MTKEELLKRYPNLKGGSRLGTTNKNNITLKAMILGALDDVGGRKYLAEQAIAQPAAFIALIGKVLPTTLAGDDGQPLVVNIVRYGDAEPLVSRADDELPTERLN